MPLLALKNIGVRKKSRWILRDVDLGVESGEAVAVFGPAGSGKSVLAEVLAGVESPARGEICVDSDDDWKGIGVAAQRFGLAADMSVFENLMLFAELGGLTSRQRSRNVSFLIELMRLGNVRNQQAGTLSFVEAAKVEIARALIPDRSVYCIDGLLDVLSSETLERVWSHLLEVRRTRGAGAIVMTGSGRIAQMCGAMAVLIGGRIGYTGGPEEFRKMAGDDMVIVGDIKNPSVRSRIREQFAVTVAEEEGFLSFKVGSSDRVVTELLEQYGSDIGYVYLKRPALEDALDISMGLVPPVIRERSERGRQ